MKSLSVKVDTNYMLVIRCKDEKVDVLPINGEVICIHEDLNEAMSNISEYLESSSQVN